LLLGAYSQLTILVNGQFTIQSPTKENEALHVQIADPIVRVDLDLQELD